MQLRFQIIFVFFSIIYIRGECLLILLLLVIRYQNNEDNCFHVFPQIVLEYAYNNKYGIGNELLCNDFT